MTKKSNAYIGQGKRDGVHVMKIGKSNDIERRERQLDISIERTAQCVSETDAFQFESDLRRFVIEQGGVRYRRTLDWFLFDKQILHFCSILLTLMN